MTSITDERAAILTSSKPSNNKNILPFFKPSVIKRSALGKSLNAQTWTKIFSKFSTVRLESVKLCNSNNIGIG